LMASAPFDRIVILGCEPVKDEHSLGIDINPSHASFAFVHNKMF
jgi:hypothetical protein